MRIIVTAGPTLEPIDPVRFISNRSTGYMGYRIAEEAIARKHYVTLISGPTKLEPPRVGRFISIETAGQLLKVLKKELKKADCLIMCAAVADFRVAEVSKRKIKRHRKLTLTLVQNRDILREVSNYKKDNLFIGVSLETEDIVKNSKKKLKSKNLDLIVANKLGETHNPFGNTRLDVLIIDKLGRKTTIYNKDKGYIAHVLLDKIEEMWYLKK